MSDTMVLVELLVGVLVLVGLVGAATQLLPGPVLVGGAIVVWAFFAQSAAGWVTLAAVIVLLLVGQVLKYALAGARLKRANVPTRTLVLGGLLALVGFFVVPVVGLVLGFVLGVFLSEYARLGSTDKAWPSTRTALAAVGITILVELGSCLLAASIWLGVVLFV